MAQNKIKKYTQTIMEKEYVKNTTIFSVVDYAPRSQLTQPYWLPPFPRTIICLRGRWRQCLCSQAVGKGGGGGWNQFQKEQKAESS